jgi:hypothetical protein
VSVNREVLRAQSPELIKEDGQRLALTLVEVSETIVRRKAAALTLRKDEPGARDPVRALAVDEVSDDDGRAPRFGPFRCINPRRAEIVQHRMQRPGRAFEDCDALRDVEVHCSLPV